jgi:hypothetical protein
MDARVKPAHDAFSGHGTIPRANRCVGNFKALADFNRFSYVWRQFSAYR